MPQNQISWTAPEYVYYPKSLAWRLILIAAAVATLIYAGWHRDVLMFITLLIVFSVGYAYAVRPPKTVRITLSGKGVHIDELLYPYDVIKSFWIFYRPPEIKNLNFETTNYINRDITIQLVDQDPNAIRAFLSELLPEDLDREEPPTDRFLRQLKF